MYPLTTTANHLPIMTSKLINRQFNENTATIPPVVTAYNDQISRHFNCSADLRQLSKGGFGIIYLAHNLTTLKPFALKMIEQAIDRNDDNAKAHHDRIHREVHYLSTLKHPNIIAYLDHLFIDERGQNYHLKHAVIATELLYDTLLQVTDYPIGQAIARKLVAEIGGALEYLHGQGISHHDIKAENIMTDRPIKWNAGKKQTRADLRKCSFKLIDFNLTRSYDTESPFERKHRSGTGKFSCPEKRSTGTPYNALSSDVYSFGVVLLQSWLGNLLLNRKKKELKGCSELWFKSASTATPAVSSKPVPNWRQFARLLLKTSIAIEAAIAKALEPESSRPTVQQLMEDFAKTK